MVIASKAPLELTVRLAGVVSGNLSSRTWRPTCLGVPAGLETVEAERGDSERWEEGATFVYRR